MKENASKSYQKRFIVIYMLCLVIALVPLLVFTQVVIKPQNLQQANIQTLNLIESKANEMGAWLDQRISEIRIINNFFQVGGRDFDTIKPYITSINDQVRDFYGNPQESYAIGKTDGLGWINDQLTINISQREYFKEAMITEKEYVIGNPVVSKSDNEPIFLICYPLKDETGKAMGFINGSINLQYLSDITDEINVYDGFAWIMNRNADVYTQREQVQKLFGEHLSQIAHHSQNGNGSFEMFVDNQRVTVFYASVPYADNWILCDAIYTNHLTASTTRIVNSLLLFAAIGSMTIWLASFILSRKLADENRRLIDEVSTIYERERKAEIRALQAQINPHFLYNTLDTIQWKALDYNAYDIAEMIQKLSMIFRISLSDGKEYIPVEQEIKHVRSYLDIQTIRYKEQFDYSISVDKASEKLIIPKLIIQPLVENSIYHGIKGIQRKGQIDVQVSLKNSMIRIEVKDNGRGIPQDKLKKLTKELKTHVESEHYGLHNVYEKLYLTYGREFHFEIRNEDGVVIVLCFPEKIGDDL